MMPTTAEYLNDLVNQKNNLATALQGKGVEVAENETFSTLVPKAVTAIEVGGGDEYEALWNTVSSNGTRGYHLFNGCTIKSLETVMKNLDTSKITNSMRMFSSATFLEEEVNLSLPVSTTAESMFAAVTAKRIRLDMPSATTLYRAFQGSYGWEYIEIYAPIATKFDEAFSTCTFQKSTQPLEIYIDAPMATSYISTFASTKMLKKLHIVSTVNVTRWDAAFGAANLESFTGELHFLASVTFSGCTKLTYITPVRITKNFTATSSPFDLPSTKAILLALEDYSGTEFEYKYSVSLSAVVIAALEAEGATAPNGLTWIDYANSKGYNI